MSGDYSGLCVRAPFSVGDYSRIPFRPEEANQAALYPEVISPALHQSIGFTWYIDDKPVACAGFVRLWDGVVNAWFHTDGEMKRTPAWRGIARDIRKAFYELAAELKLRRIQAQVPMDFPEAHALVQFLGMHPEVVLSKYGPRGEDMMQYVRLAR